MSKINVVTLCSGYDSQMLALERLKDNFPHLDPELVAWAEIDPYAIEAHNALFPQYADRNMGDITTCDWSKIGGIDLLTYSTPCQDISNAGNQKGLTEGSGTRSSIIWDVKRAIVELKPKYLLLENVKALTQKKFMPFFQEWQRTLEELGYANFWQVLNAKDFGIPQNRERVFMVSVLRTESDPNPQYNFPAPFPLEKRLKDVLEEEVDESYYLKPEQVRRIIEHCDRKVAEGCGFKPQICRTEEFKFDTSLEVKAEYVNVGGMGVPYFEIELSRKCFVGELIAEILKIIKEGPKKGIHFKNIAGGGWYSYDSIDEALQSKSIIDNLEGKFFFGWYSLEPEWEFRGFDIINP